MLKVEDGLYVIKPGEIIYEDGGVKYASSSVTLIDDDRLVLVDSGLREDWDKIKKGLDEAGFSPKEIDVLINTHLHGDHVGCNSRFEVKKFVHPRQIEMTMAEGFEPVPENISSRASVLQTPGHAEGHISIVFDDRIVIAGDAIPTGEHFEEKAIPNVHTDAEQARQSLNKISDIAEIIIPGHDSPFKVGEVK